MPPFVVDASVTLSWCFEDEATPYSRAVLKALETAYAVVSAVWPFEVANALAVAERRKRITRQGIAGFLQTLQRLPVQVERREALWVCQATIALARDHKLSAYDAAYLDLASREPLSLATLDHDLRKAGLALGVFALNR
jgi:predicted nucleic acid-binding protein